MKKAVIYYFSGTNNTKLVTKMLADRLNENDYAVSLNEINADLVDNLSIDIEPCDLLGVAYPVYAFSSPKIIKRFIKRLPNSKNQKTFILKTAGGYSDVNSASSWHETRVLKEKSYNVFYERTIVMGSNFLIKYEDSFTKCLYDTAKGKIKNMSDEIVLGKERHPKPSGFIRSIAKFVSFLEGVFGAWGFGLSLHTTKDCTKCMKCVNDCGNNNIKLKNNKIKIGTKCLICMKCVNNCPVNAIKSTGMSFLIVKGGYNINKIVKDEGIEAIDPDKVKDGKYKEFYEYLRDISK